MLSSKPIDFVWVPTFHAVGIYHLLIKPKRLIAQWFGSVWQLSNALTKFAGGARHAQPPASALVAIPC
jgi:hypothetical protein